MSDPTEEPTIGFVASPDAIGEEDWGGNESEYVQSPEVAARIEAMRNAGRSPLVGKVCVLCGAGFQAIPSFPPICRTVDEVHTKSRRLLWPLPSLYTSGATR